MYTIVYYIYFTMRRLQKKFGFKFVQRIIDYIEAFYNLYIKNKYIKKPSTESGVTMKKRKQEIIVSLTTYPARINTVWITVETLLRQTIKPDRVILWLSSNQLSYSDIPDSLLKLENRGLEIKFCDDDLKSHKKYYYVMQKYPNALIILADDDIFYPYTLVESLMKLHKKHPNDICTTTCQSIKPSIDSKPIEWSNPLPYENIEHTSKVQIFTGSGSLYPPNSLSKHVFDIESIKNLCPYADDLWLTFMALANNTKITSHKKWFAFPVMIYNTSKTSLWNINTEQNLNDDQWENIKENYSEEFKIIKSNYIKEEI